MAFYQNVQVRLNRDGGYMIMVADIPNCYESAFWTYIAGEVKSSRHFVQNVLRDCYLNNSSMHVQRAAAPRWWKMSLNF